MEQAKSPRLLEGKSRPSSHLRASQVVLMVKSPPAMQETRVQPLSWEDLLEGGHGNPLQDSCLDYPTDRGVWWATVPGFCKESDSTE